MSNEIQKAEQLPAVRDEATAMLEMIERVALNPDADVEKMRALLDMRRELMADAARVAFNRDFIEMIRELPEIGEGGQIIHNGKLISKYSRWDEDINPVITPILAKHNFFLSFETEADGTAGKVRAHLVHADGHSRSSAFTLPPDRSGAKNDVQAQGSSTSYAKRYAAAPLLNLTMKGQDDDGSGAAPDWITEDDVVQLREWIDAIGEGRDNFDHARWEAKFCQSLGIEELQFMPPAMLGKARNLLKKAEAAK